MRVAVVGLGRMVRFYAHTIAALGPAARLTAVAVSDVRAAAMV
jgi:hypothetical protein